MSLFEDILSARGLNGRTRDMFLNPSYDAKHDPFLLPDMDKAVQRLTSALKKQEQITIYGDYDIDGLTATTLLLDAFESFGFKNVKAFIPSRFVEGYGLSTEAIKRIAKDGTKLIITVDCGSLSHKEIAAANNLKIDVIVTDHHNVSDKMPPAVAVINPKRPDHKYPFRDLAGVGVAFKVVQALQIEFNKKKKTQSVREASPGLPFGQEKWLLDLVALGTVCDIVTLLDENRANVYWGLKVLSRTRRPGLRALMAVAGVEPEKITARTLGFVLGPRLNAAGRLETAQIALDLLIAKSTSEAMDNARRLNDMNAARRQEQDEIFKQAVVQAKKYQNDSVLVLSSEGWNHGIVGIVAAKILELYKKPTFVLEEVGKETKGSARSFGDFSAADAIKSASDLITRGGGHDLAAGVTMPTKNIGKFRQRLNEFYESKNLRNQEQLLLLDADIDAKLDDLTEELIENIAALEPFGHGNPQPILKTTNLEVVGTRLMGAENQHIKLMLRDSNGNTLEMLAFSAPGHFFVEPGTQITVWYRPDINEWNGRRTVEGQLLRIETL